MLRRILYILGAASLIYFASYGVLTGLGNRFTFFWLILGMVCIGYAAVFREVNEKVRAFPSPLKWGLGAVMGLCFLVFLGTELMVIFSGAHTPSPGADYVIVLGAQVRGTKPSYNLRKRLHAACKYLKENPETRVILSGGQGDDEEISEALSMAEYLTEQGIGEERMILEDASTNTEENLKFSKELIPDFEQKNPRVILATSRFHVFRSVRIARRQGFSQVEGLGAPIMWYTVPNLYIREAVAVLKYALWGQL